MDSTAEFVSDPPSPTQGSERVRTVVRFLVSVLLAAAVGALWWHHRAGQLPAHIDIVGWPTFYNFNYPSAFLAYRLAIWIFPFLTVIVFVALRWRGPLRYRGPVRTGPIELVDPEPAEELANDAMHPLLRLVQVLPPAAVVALSVSSRPASTLAHVSRRGIAAGLLYIAVVLALAVALSAILRRTERGQALRTPGAALSLVNGVAEVLATVTAMVFLSRHTVILAVSGRREYWSWFPIWLAVVLLVAAYGWMGWRLRSGWRPARVERRLRTVLVGSAGIYLLTAALPGGIGAFQGFDDAASVVGADLLTRGYFPWRDFLFIHGLFEDGWRSSIGFDVFQHSIWGASAGTAIIVAPLCWVGYYLMAAWAGRRGSLVFLGIFAIAAWGGIGVSYRFILVPVVFVLLGEALRRSQLRWMALFTTVLFIEAVLTPEASFQVVACVVAIVGCDIVHRPTGQGWWLAVRRTRQFIAVGAILSAALAIYLALNHALSAFLQYYVIFGPGHDATGAIPAFNISQTAYFGLGVSSALVVLTIWMAAWRIIGRHSWTPRDWVTVAAAILTGLYGEKALGRFDVGHIQQTIEVGLPLWIMWIASAFGAAEEWVTSRAARVSAMRPTMAIVRQPIAVAVTVILLLSVSSIGHGIWRAPGRTKALVPNLIDVPLVGYTTPTAIDPSLLSDMSTILDTYAGVDGPIFDNTNSAGYFYYLLQRSMASSFVFVSMAQTEYAQRVLIKQLKASRPAVVSFDETSFGLPAWDGPRNNVRHYEVAQYLLDGWTPIIRSHTVLFLLRNDLVANAPPPPQLKVPPLTTDLYNSNPTCDWGDAANFVVSKPAGSRVTLPVTNLGVKRNVTVSGWAYDVAGGAVPTKIVVTQGDQVIGQGAPSVSRPDVVVALNQPRAANSGFDLAVASTGSGPIGVYALGADGALHPFSGTADRTSGSFTTADGQTLTVSTPIRGAIDSSVVSSTNWSSVTVPDSVQLSSFPLATFGATSSIGAAELTLTDVAPSSGTPDSPGHDITAAVLPRGASSLAVRVGSCLQWHGYSSHTLYLSQVGGRPITSVTLSGVRDS